MRRPIRFDQSDFRRMREEKTYYVDKTGLVREVLDAPHTVLLLPRPRRFGKTLNQRMLQAFFDDQLSSGDLFEGLEIARDLDAMGHLNRYPTVFLTLKDLHTRDWQGFVGSLTLRLSNMIGEYRERILAVADPAQRTLIDDLHMRRASLADCEQALKLLAELLFRASENKVVILIDEYDHPIHHAREGGFQQEVLGFMRNFMGAALKDNAFLLRAVITGILRIGKESIFSGLNNLGVYTVLERPFAKSFGFTEEEVAKLLHDCDRSTELAQFRDWYNGYRFGNTVIYNPWSILNAAAAPQTPLQAHWINTSGNDLIRELIQADKHVQLHELERLLAGQSARKELDVNVVLRDLTTESVWSLMLFSGYLTAQSYDAASHQAELCIPNREILLFFQRIVLSWFGSSQKVNRLMEHLIEGRMEAFQIELSEVLVTILSYHDTAGKQPERLYHVFILGLLVELRNRFRISSERPAGQGRADVVMLPNHGKDPGIVLEFKAARSARATEMARAAKGALQQARNQDYAAVFRQERVQRWTIVGLALHGRKIALAWEQGGTGAVRTSASSLHWRDDQSVESAALQATRPQAEAKVVVLGTAGAGKTALVQALSGEAIDHQGQGMEVQLQLNRSLSGCHPLTVWRPSMAPERCAYLVEFGAWDVMHGSQRLLFSQRSMFLLVLDREGQEEEWLRLLRCHGGDAPIIVALTKADVNRTFDVNRRELQARYPNIVAFVRVAAPTGEGIAELSDHLAQVLGQRFATSSLPESWFKVKSSIESLVVPHISYARYDEICDEYLTSADEREALLRYLTDLGLVLHFPDLEWLDTLILEPDWVMQAIGALINHPELAASTGELELNRARRLLPDFPADRIPYLVALMERFEWCHPMSPTKILLPDLLPVSAPELPVVPQPEDAYLRFSYDYLPRSLVVRLMVRHLPYVCTSQGVRCLWRSGALFYFEELKSHVLVRVNDYDRAVVLRATGDGRTEALLNVRKGLHELHNGYYKLDATEWVACTCVECRETIYPANFLLEALYRFQAKSKKTIECPFSGDDLDIASLLEHTYGRHVPQGVGA